MVFTNSVPEARTDVSSLDTLEEGRVFANLSQAQRERQERTQQREARRSNDRKRTRPWHSWGRNNRLPDSNGAVIDSIPEGGLARFAMATNNSINRNENGGHNLGGIGSHDAFEFDESDSNDMSGFLSVDDSLSIGNGNSSIPQNHPNNGSSSSNGPSGNGPSSNGPSGNTNASGNASTEGSTAENEHILRKTRDLQRLKRALLLTLGLVGMAVTLWIYFSLDLSEQARFQSELNHDANDLTRAFYTEMANKLWSGLTVSSAYSLIDAQLTIPGLYATVPLMEYLLAIGPAFLAHSDQISYAHLLRDDEERRQWEVWALALFPTTNTSIAEGRTPDQGIYGYDDDHNPVTLPANTGPYLPLWQVSPSQSDGYNAMHDLRSRPMEREAIDEMLRKDRVVLSSVHVEHHENMNNDSADIDGNDDDDDDKPNRNDSLCRVNTDMLFPVNNGFPPLRTNKTRSNETSEELDSRLFDRIGGSLSIRFDWSAVFRGRIRDDTSLVVVLRHEASGQEYSFSVDGRESCFMGIGDRHDQAYGAAMTKSMEEIRSTLFEESVTAVHYSDFRYGEYNLPPYTATDELFSTYSIRVYPTRGFYRMFRTFAPIWNSMSVLAMFILLVFFFLAYDKLVERRNILVLSTAERSNAIVNSLFPAAIRRRLFRATDGNTRTVTTTASSVPSNAQQQSHISGQGRSSFSSAGTSTQPSSVQINSHLVPHNHHQQQVELMVRRSSTRHRMQRFLSRPFPTSLEGSEPIAELFPAVTIMFADISGFTAWSSEREPTQVFHLLETIYNAFDHLARSMGVFKVETIGDCYVAVTGLPEPHKDHALVMSRFADECLKKMKDLTTQLDVTLGPGTSDLGLRIGLHSGPVTAGVLRGDKSRFQLFGDTMNTASRMESTGIRGKVQISQATADILIHSKKSHWLAPRIDEVNAKGIGKVRTYWVKPRPRPKRKPPSAILQSALENQTPEKDTERGRIVSPLPSTVYGVRIPSLTSGGITRAHSSLSNANESEVSQANPSSIGSDDLSWWGEGNNGGDDSDSHSSASSIHDDDEYDDSMSAEPETPERMFRSIDWNTEVLLNLLERVVVARANEQVLTTTGSVAASTISSMSSQTTGLSGRQTPLRSLRSFRNVHSSSVAASNGWEHPVAATSTSSKASNRRNGSENGWPSFDRDSKYRRKSWTQRGSNTIDPAPEDKCQLSQEVQLQMQLFVSTVASLYQTHAFHNFEHACHVTQAASKLVNSVTAACATAETTTASTATTMTENSNGWNVPKESTPFFHPFGDPMDHFVIVFIALFHDVDHRGVSNSRLAKEEPELAHKYNCQSLAEHHSLDVATDLLYEHRFEDLRACICPTAEEERRFFTMLERGTIATDISRRDLKAARDEQFADLVATKNKPEASRRCDPDATAILECVLQASDVAHAMQHWHIFCKWNERLFQERHAAFRAGRDDIDPFPGWYEDQLIFYDKFIIPLAEKLNDCGLFGVQYEEGLRYAIENRAEWELKGRQLSLQFRDRANGWFPENDNR